MTLKVGDLQARERAQGQRVVAYRQADALGSRNSSSMS
jgi:hypothetical protein